MKEFQKPIEKMDPLRHPNLKKGFLKTKGNKRLIWTNHQGQYIKSVHGLIGKDAKQSVN